MKVIKDFTEKLGFDAEKVNQTYEELVGVLQKQSLTVSELLVAVSNLVYTAGASIGGYQGNGPGVEELEKLYYSEPGRLDVAMMLQAMTMASWFESYQEQVFEEARKKQS